LVVGDRDSLVCCQVFFFHNSKLPFPVYGSYPKAYLRIVII
jgi:hypothetical protein